MKTQETNIFGNTARDSLLRIDLDREIKRAKEAEEKIQSSRDEVYASSITLTHGEADGVLVATLWNNNGSEISNAVIDLPTEHTLVKAELEGREIVFYSTCGYDDQGEPIYIEEFRCDLTEVFAQIQFVDEKFTLVTNNLNNELKETNKALHFVDERVANEEVRAKAEENRLNTELQNTNSALHFVDEKLDAEINRSTAEDERLNNELIDTNKALHFVDEKLDEEIIRAKLAETKLTDDLNTHVTNLSNEIINLANRTGEKLVEEKAAREAKDAELEEAIRWEKGTGENSVQTKGTGCVAEGNYSVAEGWNSKTLQKDTDPISGQAAHAEGAQTNASGFAAHSEGGRTSASGEHAHAEGYETTALGNDSHTEGNHTITNNFAEHAQGKFNVSHADSDVTDGNGTISSIGIGTAEVDPETGRFIGAKNALEIMKNGDQYILGIGGYNGKELENAKTVQDIINGKQEHLIAGQNIIIDETTNTISSTNGVANIEDGSEIGSLIQKKDSSYPETFTNRYYGDTVSITNDNEGTYSILLGGKGHIGRVDADGKAIKRSIAAGSGSVVNASASAAIAGDDNVIDSKGYGSLAAGFVNHINSSYSVAFGTQNEINGTSSYAFVSGVGNKVSNNRSKVVFGEWNFDNPDTAFEIGQGISDTNRKNIFEIYKDGSIKIGNTTLTEEELFKLKALLDTMEAE